MCNIFIITIVVSNYAIVAYKAYYITVKHGVCGSIATIAEFTEQYTTDKSQ